MLLRHSSRGGYVFLLAVLIVGAIGIATTVSLMLLGLGSEQTGQAAVETHQAYEMASSCAEQAIRSLRADLSYNGDEILTFPEGNCIIRPIGGYGNVGRTL